MTETELQEIEKRCESATPGPWSDGVAGHTGVVHFNGDDVVYVASAKPHDRVFIIGARTDIPALLSTVRELQRQVQERWIPIEKQHPEEEGRYFILYSHKGQPPKPFVADLSFDGLGWAWSGFINDDNRVTHWMPIPEQTP